MSKPKIQVIIDLVSPNAARQTRTVFQTVQLEGEKVNRKRVSDEQKTAKEIEKINQQTAKSAQKFAKESEKIDDQLARQRIANANKSAKAAADSFLKSLKEVETGSKQVAENTKGVFSGSLLGTFFGNLAGSITDKFLGALSQLPSKAKETIDEMIKISQERANALKGLESIATFKGIDPKAAEDSVKNLRLVKAGILDLGAASSALKSLLASGFNLDQANTILERFSDSAAFGKQSALSFSEAIERAAEGIKNQNSELVDNVGLTKNLSVILKERGFELEDLTDKQKSQNAIQALYNGIIEETKAQVGDADKLTQGYTGSVAGLDNAYKNLYARGGDLITQSPEIIAANRVQKEQVEDLTKALFDQGSETAKTAQFWLKMYAEIKAGTLPWLAFTQNAFMSSLNFTAAYASGLAGVTLATIESLLTQTTTILADPYNSLVSKYNAAAALVGSSSRLEMWDTNFNGKWSDSQFKASQGFFKSSGEYWQKMLKSAEEVGQASANLKKYTDETTKPGAINYGFLKGDKPLTKNFAANIVGGGTAGGTGSGNSGRGSSAKVDFRLSGRAQSIVNAAQKLGISPLDLATIIGFETSGTYNPNIVGGEGNRYRGLIQFGPDEQKKYFKPGQSFEQQIQDGVVRYFQDRFAKAGKTTQGASLLDLYTTVLGGNPNANPYAKDSNGTSAISGVNQMMGRHRAEALKRFFGGSTSNIPDSFSFIDQKGLEKYRADAEKQEEISTALTVLQNAQAVYGKEAIKIPETTDEILKAYAELRQATRDRVVKDTSTRGRFAKDTGPDTPLALRKDVNGNYLIPDDQLGNIDFTATRSGSDRQGIRDYNSLKKSLQEQISGYERGGRELSEYERVQKEITENYANLSEAQKQDLLNIAQQTDAWKKFADTQEKVKDFFGEAFANIIDRNWKGLLDGVLGRIKRFLVDAATAWATSDFMKSFGGSGSSGSSSGFSLGNLIQGLFGGGKSVNTSGTFGGGYLGNGIFSLAGDFIPDTSTRQRIVGGSGGGMWGGWNDISGGKSILSSIFGKQEATFGGLTARELSVAGQKNSFLGNLKSLFTGGGLLGSLATVAPLLGLSLGGKVGGPSTTGNILGSIGGFAGGVAALGFLAPSVLTGVFGGLGLGLAGSLTAAAAATGIGLIAAPALLLGGWLLGRNKQRRQEETIRNQAMIDTLGALNTIKSQLDARPPQIDPETAKSQANQAQQTYFSEMSQLQDSKTKRIAIKDGDERVRPLVTSIMASADAAKAYNINRGNIQSQFIGEFAGGNYFKNEVYESYKRLNGMMPGTYTGTDYIKALIGDGEMVLNPKQISSVRKQAGFDVFAGANIPNYVPKFEPPKVPQFATGVSFAQAPNNVPSQNSEPIYITVERVVVDSEQIVFEGMKSSTNQRVVVSAVKKGHKRQW